MLSKPGVEAIFSERFNQDPLESFFGKQRAQGGYNDNPPMGTFLYGTTSLRLQGSIAKDPVNGNSSRKRPRAEEKKDQEVIDETPLPKRPRTKKKS